MGHPDPSGYRTDLGKENTPNHGDERFNPAGPGGLGQHSEPESDWYGSGSYQGAPGFPPPPAAGGGPWPQGYGAVQSYATGSHLVLDPVSGLAIPAGTQLASSGRRIGAYFMEVLLLIVTLGIGYVVWTLVVWGQGQTPGKQVLGMKCYRPADGKVAHWGWMFLREFVGGLLYEVTFAVVWLVSCIMLVIRPDKRTIHDFIAGTIVLYDPQRVLR